MKRDLRSTFTQRSMKARYLPWGCLRAPARRPSTRTRTRTRQRRPMGTPIDRWLSDMYCSSRTIRHLEKMLYEKICVNSANR